MSALSDALTVTTSASGEPHVEVSVPRLMALLKASEKYDATMLWDGLGNLRHKVSDQIQKDLGGGPLSIRFSGGRFPDGTLGSYEPIEPQA